MSNETKTYDSTELLMQCGHDVLRFFGGSPSAHVEIDEHGWLGLTGEKGSADLNMAFIARSAPPSLVERYVKEITDRDLAAIMIVDEAAPHLVEVATALGWMAVGQVPVMVWEDGPALAPNERFTVRLATDDEHEAVCRLMAQGFSLDEDTVIRALPQGVYSDGCEAWVVERDGELLGTGSLIRTDDHVGVYSMATPERSQRQGVGRAVLETAMAHHVATGAKRFTLEATEAGSHLYEQLGYQTVATPTVLVAGESTQFPG